jgi:hypothetical protein
VKSPRVSGKHGEPSEMWGEEVGHVFKLLHL